jgi:Zn-dependent proteases
MDSHFAASVAEFILILFSFAIVLTIHEAAHAWMAHMLGDDTAKRLGRLSLNPLVHIDPLGLLCLLIFRIGWAKPVLFDQRNFRWPKVYSILTAYAGPLSNFLLALVALVCLKFLPVAHLSVGVAVTGKQLFTLIAEVSVMLGVFNLLPIPPLDGSHLLMALLVDRYPRLLLWLYTYSLFILIALFMFVPQFLVLLRFLIDTVYNFLYGLVF